MCSLDIPRDTVAMYAYHRKLYSRDIIKKKNVNSFKRNCTLIDIYFRDK